jgi:predicted component of type VI protein secretion system
MLEFFVLSGPDAGLSARLGPGAVIGRAEGVSLRLHDRSISRRHAELQERAGAFFLVDLGSTNGLLKDGERAAELELADFLEFKAGEVLLRVRTTTPEPAAGAEPVEKPEPEPTPAPEVSFSFGGGVAAPAPKGKASAPEPELEIEWEDSPEPPNLREAQREALIHDLQKTHGGLLRSDLSQYPGWAQALIGLLVFGLGIGIAWGLYTFVIGTRG